LARTRPAFATAGKRHLDVGCDTGLFLESFSRLYGTRPTGIDVAKRAVAIARAKGIEAYDTDLLHASDLPDFHLITLIDVIEHVPDPMALLRAVRGRLAADGVCYVETPNVRSTVYRVGRLLCNATGGRPAWICDRLFLPEHVQYLSATGLAAAARAAGLSVVLQGRRRLQGPDVNTSPLVNVAVQALQVADRITSREILHWAVLTP
jgi:2-polyprenyl-3-methyl-5-hydroxy-6-metoxy-1,4-benzoquinol methylase